MLCEERGADGRWAPHTHIHDLCPFMPGPQEACWSSNIHGKILYQISLVGTGRILSRVYIHTPRCISLCADKAKKKYLFSPTFDYSDEYKHYIPMKSEVFKSVSYCYCIVDKKKKLCHILKIWKTIGLVVNAELTCS